MPKHSCDRSRRQPSRNGHELRSISASHGQIDKLRLPVIIVHRTRIPSRAVVLVRRDAKSAGRRNRARKMCGRSLPAECIFQIQQEHDRECETSRTKRSAVQWLRAKPFSNDKVFALGFCAGGRMAFVAAARAGVDAAVSFYGMGIAKHDAEFAQLNCPVQLHYGLKDPHIPRPEIDAVTLAAVQRPNIEIFLYAE